MSGHEHYQTLRRSVMLFPALLFVLLLEAPAAFFSNRLAVGAHSFDVFSDVISFLIVSAGAAFSGFLDDHGRQHKKLHREQKLIAIVSLLILWLGAVLVFAKSVASFGHAGEARGLADWWVVIGPSLAVGVYWWVEKKLEDISLEDLTAASLVTHVRGDVLVSLVALILTVLSLVISNSWINPTGGILMSVILVIVSRGLIKRIWRAGLDSKGVLTTK